MCRSNCLPSFGFAEADSPEACPYNEPTMLLSL